MPSGPLAPAMRRDLADIVCCPVHKSRLTLTVTSEDARGDISSGTLHCSQCPFDYPIEEGVPNLLPPEYHVAEVKEKQPPAARAPKGKA